MARAGNLGICPSRNRETAYRRQLQNYASAVFAVLSNDVNGDTGTLEDDMIVLAIAFIASVDGYHRRQLTANYRRFFNENEAPIRIARALEANFQLQLDAARINNVNLIRDISLQQRFRIFDAIGDLDNPVPLADRTVSYTHLTLPTIYSV